MSPPHAGRHMNEPPSRDSVPDLLLPTIQTPPPSPAQNSQLFLSPPHNHSLFHSSADSESRDSGRSEDDGRAFLGPSLLGHRERFYRLNPEDLQPEDVPVLLNTFKSLYDDYQRLQRTLVQVEQEKRALLAEVDALRSAATSTSPSPSTSTSTPIISAPTISLI